MATLEAAKKVKETIRRTRITGTSQEVEFTYHAPNAKKVCMAGKFNDWNTKSLAMKKDRDGTWKIKVKLTPGKYEYKYFVDGTWAQDLPCTDLVPNPFGTFNCEIKIE
ncbi:MAG TPA: glycogen-binding domain-containing protein [Nitrospirota bacterium]|nr:glycogen-binding domain-containing protein [Nitrospirota bacterium]